MLQGVGTSPHWPYTKRVKERGNHLMNKATQRYTKAQRQAAQAKADRRAAALDRRGDDYRQDANWQRMYAIAQGGTI